MPELDVATRQALTTRLEDLKFPNASSLTKVDDNTYLLTTTNGKKYNIDVRDDNTLSVTRDYTPREKSLPHKVYQAVLYFFGKTSCQHIQKAFTSDPTLFQLAVLPEQKVQAEQEVQAENFSNKNYSDKKYSKAAIKIQRAVREFHTRKALACTEDKTNNPFYSMHHPTRIGYDGKPLTYYFHKERLLPGVRTPEKIAEPPTSKLPKAEQKAAPTSRLPEAAKPDPKDPDVLKGKRKILTGQDKTQVALEWRQPISGNEMKQINAIAEHLKSYQSCAPAIAVNNRLVLAKNGGVDLRQHCKNKTIKMNMFHDVCKDLRKIHENGMALRDIKPENMTLGSDGKIKFIDLDDTYIPGVTNRKGMFAQRGSNVMAVTGSAGYLTEGLLRVRESNDKELFRCDNYALLVTMAETTCYDFDNLGATEKFPENTIFEHRHRPKLYQWVETYIKPDYQQEVYDFLSDPALSYFDKPLEEVINWDKNL